MDKQQQEQLYALLPTIYRQRDEEQGGALRALMAALESEFRTLESDMDALYANWFIDTCEEWVVPYIAELVGTYPSRKTIPLFTTQRRQVANTIAYRRRKGLPATLEQVVRDVSGWYIHIVEYQQLIAMMQHLTYLRPYYGRALDLRQTSSLSALEGPFDAAAHSIDIHGTTQQSHATSGKYDPNTIGLFVWRLRSYLLTNVPATVIAHATETKHQPASIHFTFDPPGRDIPLFHQPQQLTDLHQRTQAINVPIALSRAMFAEDLATYQAPSSADGSANLSDLNSHFYGPDRSLCIFLNGHPLGPDQVCSVDLEQWNTPRHPRHPRKDVIVGIDVERGRFAFLDRQQWSSDTQVTANYCYGFSADVGGGPYTRATGIKQTQQNGNRVNVLQGGKVSSLTQALTLWKQYCENWQAEQHSESGPVYTICIVDNGTYWEDNLVVDIPPGAHLSIEAADGVRPVIRSYHSIMINSPSTNASLHINGLFIESKLAIEDRLKLTIDHCTLMPYGIESQASFLQLTITSSIIGPIRVTHGKGDLTIRESILDATAGYALDTQHTGHRRTGYHVRLECTTIFGRVRLQELQSAQNVLFTDTITVAQQQTGSIGYSYVPPSSQTPPRERCQPEMVSNQLSGHEIYPLFSSTHYGDPAYAQLSEHCAHEILRGASDGSEMGVFHDMRTAQRQENIRSALDEYMPFGLSAGIFYMT